VKVFVTIPSIISERQRELLMEFAKEGLQAGEGSKAKSEAYEGGKRTVIDEYDI
jgi:hypothetical protein